MIDAAMLGLNVSKIVGVEARCLCPFHNDSRPSSSFNMQTGSFHCFACGANAKAEQLAKLLGGYVVEVNGAELKSVGWGTENEWRWVLSCELALDNEYLKGRGVTEWQVKRYDIRQFSNGVIFLFKSPGGEVIGAQIRTYSGYIRYINLGEKPIFWPFEALKAKRDDPVVVVEGVFGALNGLKNHVNTVSVIGANSASQSISQLSGIHPLVIAFDNDQAGHLNVAKTLLQNTGILAIAPGFVADEAIPGVWQGLKDMRHAASYMVNHYDFLRASDASRETWSIFEKFVEKRKKCQKQESNRPKYQRILS